MFTGHTYAAICYFLHVFFLHVCVSYLAYYYFYLFLFIYLFIYLIIYLFIHLSFVSHFMIKRENIQESHYYTRVLIFRVWTNVIDCTVHDACTSSIKRYSQILERATTIMRFKLFLREYYSFCLLVKNKICIKSIITDIIIVFDRPVITFDFDFH